MIPLITTCHGITYTVNVTLDGSDVTNRADWGPLAARVAALFEQKISSQACYEENGCLKRLGCEVRVCDDPLAGFVPIAGKSFDTLIQETNPGIDGERYHILIDSSLTTRLQDRSDVTHPVTTVDDLPVSQVTQLAIDAWLPEKTRGVTTHCKAFILILYFIKQLEKSQIFVAKGLSQLAGELIRGVDLTGYSGLLSEVMQSCRPLSREEIDEIARPYRFSAQEFQVFEQLQFAVANRSGVLTSPTEKKFQTGRLTPEDPSTCSRTLRTLKKPVQPATEPLQPRAGIIKTICGGLTTSLRLIWDAFTTG